MTGIASTKFREHVYSVIFFFFKGKEYLGASGNKKIFEVFDISQLSMQTPLSKYSILKN